MTDELIENALKARQRAFVSFDNPWNGFRSSAAKVSPQNTSPMKTVRAGPGTRASPTTTHCRHFATVTITVSNLRTKAIIVSVVFMSLSLPQGDGSLHELSTRSHAGDLVRKQLVLLIHRTFDRTVVVKIIKGTAQTGGV